MLIEIDSTEILAYVLSKANKEEITISLQQIRRYARELEKNNHSVVADGGIQSVLGFRSIFIKNVRIKNEEVVVEHISTIKPILKRYIPQYEFMKVLDED